MKKSLYLTETKHTLICKILILLLFFSVTSMCFSRGDYICGFLRPFCLGAEMHLGRTATYHLRTFLQEKLKHCVGQSEHIR